MFGQAISTCVTLLLGRSEGEGDNKFSKRPTLRECWGESGYEFHLAGVVPQVLLVEDLTRQFFGSCRDAAPCHGGYGGAKCMCRSFVGFKLQCSCAKAIGFEVAHEG